MGRKEQGQKMSQGEQVLSTELRKKCERDKIYWPFLLVAEVSGTNSEMQPQEAFFTDILPIRGLPIPRNQI